MSTDGVFINGGPICCFQQLEATGGHVLPLYRAQLLYVPHQAMSVPNPHNNSNSIHPPPIWVIPEAFFPSKKLDTFPPRTAQPLLHYSVHYQVVGPNTFDPLSIIRALHRLDELTILNRGAVLQRDSYLCDWLGNHHPIPPPVSPCNGPYFLPVLCRGAARPSLGETGDDALLGVGILHIPGHNLSSRDTMVFLPPEPHILLGLLLRVAEAENRAIKKGTGGKMAAVFVDEHWRTEFKAYLFRVPLYYHHALRRCLRPILPPSVHSQLGFELNESCLSRICVQKIRSGELFARESNERIERLEEELRRGGVASLGSQDRPKVIVSDGLKNGYAQYNRKSTKSSYLAALRNMPPPWRMGFSGLRKRVGSSGDELSACIENGTVNERLRDLPHSCLLAYYESRRKWIFGGSGLTTRGLSVEGVNNDGSNCHRYSAYRSTTNEPLLAAVNIGVSTLNKGTIGKMGDFRERLLWSRQPVVGYGCNDSTGSAMTTAADGSPLWSVDDDALPINFFDPKNGKFSDSVQTRVRARLMINFGNPYKDKRGDSLVPEEFSHQRPPCKQEKIIYSPLTPPGSPPHGLSDYIKYQTFNYCFCYIICAQFVDFFKFLGIRHIPHFRGRRR